MEKKILEKYGNVVIYENKPFNKYEVKLPKISDDVRETTKILYDFIIRKNDLKAKDLVKALVEELKDKNFELYLKMSNVLEDLAKQSFFLELDLRNNNVEENESFANSLLNFLKKHGIKESKEIATSLLMDLIGFGELNPILSDDLIEEIMVDSVDRVFIYHREQRECITNIKFNSTKDISDLIYRIAYMNNKPVGPENPFLDAHLIGGSRVNATLKVGTPDSPTITIRKFNEVPLSIVDLIKNKTISMEVAAYIWAFVDGFGSYPMNVLVIGGTGSGKTTLLNVLTNFMPRNQRIVSIEDTLELNIPHLNKIRMEAHTVSETKDLDLNDLLKNALRMRPQRILLGEVRGDEAITLFTAMDTGHRGVMGTMHSNTAKEALIRLKTYPMNVPEIMFPLMDVIVTISYKRIGKKLVRKITQVAEIIRSENTVAVSELFAWDPISKELKEVSKFSQKREHMCTMLGISKEHFRKSIEERVEVLSRMATGNYSFEQVQETIDEYYKRSEL